MNLFLRCNYYNRFSQDIFYNSVITNFYSNDNSIFYDATIVSASCERFLYLKSE